MLYHKSFLVYNFNCQTAVATPSSDIVSDLFSSLLEQRWVEMNADKCCQQIEIESSWNMSKEVIIFKEGQLKSKPPKGTRSLGGSDFRSHYTQRYAYFAC